MACHVALDQGDLLLTSKKEPEFKADRDTERRHLFFSYTTDCLLLGVGDNWWLGFSR